MPGPAARPSSKKVTQRPIQYFLYFVHIQTDHTRKQQTPGEGYQPDLCPWGEG
jgi:hypothetical protein